MSLWESVVSDLRKDEPSTSRFKSWICCSLEESCMRSFTRSARSSFSFCSKSTRCNSLTPSTGLAFYVSWDWIFSSSLRACRLCSALKHNASIRISMARSRWENASKTSLRYSHVNTFSFLFDGGSVKDGRAGRGGKFLDQRLVASAICDTYWEW